VRLRRLAVEVRACFEGGGTYLAPLTRAAEPSQLNWTRGAELLENIADRGGGAMAACMGEGGVTQSEEGEEREEDYLGPDRFGAGWYGTVPESGLGWQI
jgi:hypothetical protein